MLSSTAARESEGNYVRAGSVTYIERAVDHGQVLERLGIDKERGNEPNTRQRRICRLQRVRPGLVQAAVRTKRTRLTRERRDERTTVVQHLAGIVGVRFDVRLQPLGVARARARDGGHIEGEEKLERRSAATAGAVGAVGGRPRGRGPVRVVLTCGGKSVRDLRWLPAVSADVEGESVDTFGRSKCNV